jgi:hypothetical protein
MTSDTSPSLGERELLRYPALFVALLLFLSGPFLVPDRLEGLLASLLFTIVALAALVTAAQHRGTLIIGLLLAVPALLAGWLEPTEPRLAIAGGISQVLFMTLFAAGILNHVIRAKRVTSDLLFGVAAVYLLLAAIWAVGYGIAETIEPGAIALLLQLRDADDARLRGHASGLRRCPHHGHAGGDARPALPGYRGRPDRGALHGAGEREQRDAELRVDAACGR